MERHSPGIHASPSRGARDAIIRDIRVAHPSLREGLASLFARAPDARSQCIA
jgi:hypothetical protein